jgi:hypothetical protein
MSRRLAAAAVAAVVLLGALLPARVTASALARFRVYPRSAISMNGFNYYINFQQAGPYLVSRVAELCVAEPSCLAFDFEGGDTDRGIAGIGYLHRVLGECAAAAGGVFQNGSLPSSTFYELLPSFRPSNSSRCDVSRIASADVPSVSNTDVVITAMLTLLVWVDVLGGVLSVPNRIPDGFRRVPPWGAPWCRLSSFTLWTFALLVRSSFFQWTKLYECFFPPFTGSVS